MENNRGQSIFLSVVGIATLLVAIVGATFAYFSITVQGNENASSIRVTTATLGDVTYTGTGAEINVENTYPGWSASRQFTISTAAGTTGTVQYQIILETTEDELAEEAATKHDFVYSLNGTATGSGTVATAVSNADVPTGASSTLGTGTLVNEDSHAYTFAMLLKETGSDQNYLQGLEYNGRIQVVVSTSDGLRTYDTTTQGWKQWTSNSDNKTTTE